MLKVRNIVYSIPVTSFKDIKMTAIDYNQEFYTCNEFFIITLRYFHNLLSELQNVLFLASPSRTHFSFLSIKLSNEHPQALMQFLDITEEIYPEPPKLSKDYKTMWFISCIFTENWHMTGIPKWVICFHSSQNEMAYVFSVTLTLVFFVLSTYIHETFEKLCCTLL